MSAVNPVACYSKSIDSNPEPKDDWWQRHPKITTCAKVLGCTVLMGAAALLTHEIGVAAFGFGALLYITTHVSAHTISFLPLIKSALDVLALITAVVVVEEAAEKINKRLATVLSAIGRVVENIPNLFCWFRSVFSE